MKHKRMNRKILTIISVGIPVFIIFSYVYYDLIVHNIDNDNDNEYINMAEYNSIIGGGDYQNFQSSSYGKKFQIFDRVIWTSVIELPKLSETYNNLSLPPLIHSNCNFNQTEFTFLNEILDKDTNIEYTVVAFKSQIELNSYNIFKGNRSAFFQPDRNVHFNIIIDQFDWLNYYNILTYPTVNLGWIENNKIFITETEFNYILHFQYMNAYNSLNRNYLDANYSYGNDTLYIDIVNLHHDRYPYILNSSGSSRYHPFWQEGKVYFGTNFLTGKWNDNSGIIIDDSNQSNKIGDPTLNSSVRLNIRDHIQIHLPDLSNFTIYELSELYSTNSLDNIHDNSTYYRLVLSFDFGFSIFMGNPIYLYFVENY